jgi:hypothetical protein
MNHADGYVCLFTWFFCLFLLSCFPLSWKDTWSWRYANMVILAWLLTKVA